MFDEFAKNITAANGTGGDIYRNYNAFQVNASPAQFAGKKAQFDANNEEIARSNAEAAAKAEAAIAEKRAADEEKAVMRLKPDGHGYEFFTGTGRKININEFSMKTGKRPDEILEGSDDPRDQKFVQDYKAMRSISNAWVNGDNKTLQEFRAADPKKFNQLVSKYKSPRDMVNAFTDYYSDYYGATENKQDKAPAFSPNPGLTGPGSDPRGKAVAKQLAGSPLSQTLSPIKETTGKPGGVGDLWTDNLLTNNPISNMIPGTFGNKLSDYNKRRKEEEDRNPWLAYSSYLRGR